MSLGFWTSTPARPRPRKSTWPASRPSASKQRSRPARTQPGARRCRWTMLLQLSTPCVRRACRSGCPATKARTSSAWWKTRQFPRRLLPVPTVRCSALNHRFGSPDSGPSLSATTTWSRATLLTAPNWRNEPAST
ncbi:hypothetical protein SDC9_206989 [bioreactor metagenome]|uniref:Uncharacterized protein n=1 Tax=bioreactor metagenome TaxID=1076179 RepID=A0A645J6I2_9ZZZZ